MNSPHFLLALAVSLAAASLAASQEHVTVAVSEIRPCVIYKGESIQGFSAELWRACAQDMGIRYQFERVPFEEKLDNVQSHEADAAIGGISITESRERALDFSLPTLNSGLRILTRRDPGIMPILSARTWRVLAGTMVFVGFFGHVLWLIERGSPAIHNGYFPGILDAFWCVVATMSTVGYGDVVPKRWNGRLLAVVIMLVGIGLFGLIVAAFTADILEEKKVSHIRSYHDLAGLPTATKAGTTSSDFLNAQGIRVRETNSFAEACELLKNGDVDAVVYDDPSVRYVVRTTPGFTLGGEVFQQQYYGFAFASESPLVERFNQALLRFKEAGHYDQLYQKWFGTE